MTAGNVEGQTRMPGWESNHNHFYHIHNIQISWNTKQPASYFTQPIVEWTAAKPSPFYLNGLIDFNNVHRPTRRRWLGSYHDHAGHDHPGPRSTWNISSHRAIYTHTNAQPAALHYSLAILVHAIPVIWQLWLLHGAFALCALNELKPAHGHGHGHGHDEKEEQKKNGAN